MTSEEELDSANLLDRCDSVRAWGLVRVLFPRVWLRCGKTLISTLLLIESSFVIIQACTRVRIAMLHISSDEVLLNRYGMRSLFFR